MKRQRDFGEENKWIEGRNPGGSQENHLLPTLSCITDKALGKRKKRWD